MTALTTPGAINLSKISTIQTKSSSLFIRAAENTKSQTTKPVVNSRVIFGDGCVIGPTAYVSLSTTAITPCISDVSGVDATEDTSGGGIDVTLSFGRGCMLLDMARVDVQVNIAVSTIIGEGNVRNLTYVIGDNNVFGIKSCLSIVINANDTTQSSSIIGDRNVFETRSQVSLTTSSNKKIIGDTNCFGIYSQVDLVDSSSTVDQNGFIFYCTSDGENSLTKFRRLTSNQAARRNEEVKDFDCGDAKRAWEASFSSST